jgi:hypothetical protein
LPGGRWRPRAVGAPDGSIYLVGGRSGPTNLADVLQYEPPLNTWTQRAPLRLGRYGLAVGLIGNQLFAAGGWTDTGVTNKLERATLDRLPAVPGAGGPYTVALGGSVQLNGSGSDPEGSPLGFAWDLNGDLVYETNGQNPTFSTAGVTPGVRTIRVRTLDPQGAYAIGSTTVTVTGPAGSCPSRPTVGVATSKAAAGQLRSILTAQANAPVSGNVLLSVRFTRIVNAAVTLNGSPVTVGPTIDLPGGSQQATILVDRHAPAQNPGLASTVSFAVTDVCGEWKSFVGGGPGAF